MSEETRRKAIEARRQVLAAVGGYDVGSEKGLRVASLVMYEVDIEAAHLRDELGPEPQPEAATPPSAKPAEEGEDEVAGGDGTIATLLENRERELTELRETIGTLNRHGTEVREALGADDEPTLIAARRVVADLKAERGVIVAMRQELDRVVAERDEAKRHADMAHAARNTLEARASRFERDLAAEKGHHEAAEKHLEIVQADLAAAREELRANTDFRIADAQKETAEALAELDSAQAKVRELEAERMHWNDSALRLRAETAQRALGEARAALNESETERVKMRRELTDFQLAHSRAVSALSGVQGTSLTKEVKP